MKRFGMFAVVALLAVVAAGCAGSSDKSSRRAAIGSSTPVAGAGSMTSPLLLSGTPIRVDSWDWGIETTSTVGGATGGAGAGRATAKQFEIQKNIDDASNQLFVAAGRGTNLQTLTFKVGTTLTYVFSTVLVKSIEQNGEGAQGDEKVTFVYGKVEITNATNSSKPSRAYWDFIQNIGS